MTLTEAKNLPGNTVNERALRGIAIYASVADNRIRHMPAALRRANRDGATSRIVADAARVEKSYVGFRPDCDSGRSGHWYRWSWQRAAAGVADLRRRGYSVADARRIAAIAVRCDKCTWAVMDAPPEIQPLAEWDVYCGWDKTVASEMGVTVDHVRRWTTWRKQFCIAEAATAGRRTRKFWAIAELMTRRAQEAEIQASIKAMSPAALALAKIISTVLPSGELGRGWMVSTDAIHTSHDFSLRRCPDWQARLASIDITCHDGGTLSLSSASSPISGGPLGRAKYEASRETNPLLAVYDRCA